jgi:Ca2+-binding RTX toxin-like protein
VITVSGGSGNDTISLDGTNGALPRAVILGGDGNDVITGGAGIDQLFGQQGDDTLLGMGGSDVLDGGDGNDFMDGGTGDDRLNGEEGDDVLIGGDGIDVISGNQGDDLLIGGAGNDLFPWGPGDGSDVVEGQAGFDALQFDGSDADERIDLSANGERLRLTRDVGNVTLDVNDVEHVNLTPVDGADTLTVHDLSGTDVTEVNIDLIAFDGGDGQVDTVIVNGTNSDDAIRVAEDTFAGDARTTVLGLAAQVNITDANAANARLMVNALNGDDTVDASGLSADAILLTEDGGNGDDLLVGGAGDDTLLGGNGDDLLIGGPGQDVLDGGHGHNHLVRD